MSERIRFLKPKKDLFWIGSSKKDLSKFPEAVRKSAAFCLDLIREGDKPEKEKVLKGFKGTSVRELKLNERAGTFRVVYTVQFEKAIYVLHAFQKKSTKGIETTKQDIDLIEQRLQSALADYKTRS
jgi:phage-related protein